MWWKKVVEKGFETLLIASDAAIREYYDDPETEMLEEYYTVQQPSIYVLKFEKSVSLDEVLEVMKKNIDEYYEDDYYIIVQVAPNVLIVTNEIECIEFPDNPYEVQYFHSLYSVDEVVDMLSG